MSDNTTYMVSLVSDATWTFLNNVTTTAQVSMRLAPNAHFIAERITSLVPDTKWIDNSYLERPTGDVQSNYIPFALQSVGTKALTFEAGRELPLFTFQNIGTSCFGSIELTNNNSATTKSVVANGHNIGQHIATLGAGGESFVSNMDSGSVLCQGTATSTVETEPLFNITKAYPIPTPVELTIEWQLADTKLDNFQLIVTNVLGETLLVRDLRPSKGVQAAKIGVEA